MFLKIMKEQKFSPFPLILMGLLMGAPAQGEISGPQLLDAVSKAIGMPKRYTNSLKLMADGEFYPTYLTWITEATQSIDLSVYTWCNDEVGGALARALASKARQGVRVRVLVDDFTVKEHDINPRILIEAGVHFMRYNRFGDRSYNDHIHDKVMVFDGKKALSGGANFCSHYFEDSGKGKVLESGYRVPEVLHDFAMAVDGPLAFDYQRKFDRYWDEEARFQREKDRMYDGFLSADFFAGTNRPYRQAAQKTFGPTKSIYSERSGLYPLVEGHAPSAVLMWQRPHLDKQDAENFLKAYIGLVSSAQSEIILYTPYFLLRPALKKALIEMRGKGVNVHIFTDIGPHNDLPDVGKEAVKMEFADFLKAGVGLWIIRHRGQHAKALLVDRKVLAVGSNNFTRRSMKHNGEQMIATDDQLPIQKFLEVMWRDVQNEYEQVDPKTYQAPRGIIPKIYGRLR